MASEVARLTTELALRDNMSAPLGRTLNNVNSLNRGLSQMGRGVGQVAGGLGRLATIGAVGFVGAIGASVKAASDFEASLNTINTIAQTTPSNLADIGAGIRAMSRETGASLDDLTKGYYDLLSAGIDVADAQKVLGQANLLATGSLGTTAQGVDVLTTALNAFRLTGDDAATVAEELAVAVERGKVTLDQIAPSYANVAQTAAVAGVGTNEIAAAFANLTAQGVPAAEVTTQMNRAILSLIAPNAQLNELQKDLGVNFAEIARDKGLVVALEQLRVAAEKAGIPLLDLLGRQEAFKFTIATTGDNLGRYNEDLAAVADATGTLADQVGARRQGLAFQFAVLKANIRDVGITVGSSLLPVLTPLIQDLVDTISEPQTQRAIQDFATDLADGVRDFIAAAKSGDLQPFIDGLRILGDVAAKAYDIFRKLPPDVQGLLVTGAALNRLSGGALVGGAANIVGGVLSIVFQRGASPANPLWVQSATGGVGGPGGVVAGGGNNLLRLLGLAGAVVGGVALGSTIGNSLIDPTIDPARRAAGNAVNRAIGTGSTSEIARALAAIQGQLNTDDLASQIALAVDADGVRTSLEEQRAILGDLLAAQTGGGKDTLARLREGQSIEQAQTAQLQRNFAAVAADHAARNADAARLLQSQAQANMKLQQISDKDFAPRINVAVTSQVTISTTALQAKITQQQLIVGTGPQP